MRFPITLGSVDVQHEAYDTSAPADYDGFGTFTVADYGTERTVLIRSEHLTWQLMRYQSGNHTAVETEHRMEDIADVLWRRIQGWEK